MDSVETGIRRRQSRVGNVHETEFQAPVIFRAQDVGAEGSLVHEVHCVHAHRDVMIAEQHSPRQFKVWREAAAAFEIPFQTERVETGAVSVACRLKCDEYWDGIDSVLEPSAKKAGKVGAG